MTLLDRCIANKPAAIKIEEKLYEVPKKSELLVAIENALTNGILDKDELQTFILKNNIEDLNEGSNSEIDKLINLGVIKLADREKWKFVSKMNDDEIMVSDGNRGGIIPSGYPPHISWLCPVCLTFGPWNGNRCETCGHFSTPD